jgi:hypothetical protein
LTRQPSTTGDRQADDDDHDDLSLGDKVRDIVFQVDDDCFGKYSSEKILLHTTSVRYFSAVNAGLR